jgi:diguanylate cyclase (GGDEF)-like protein
MVRREIRLDSAVADRLVAMLEEGPSTPAGWRETMSWLETESGPDVYAVLLFVLTQLDFAAEKAHDHWLRILRQWEDLNRRVPEKVDLRVAVLQYFLRSQRKLHNPAIVEIKILRRAQDSAIYDELTRLYNFRYFQDRVLSEVRRATRYDTPLTLLMIDADDFKALNDSRGHLAGNMALRRLAAVLRKTVREVDVTARYGGEEFAILLPSTPKLAALKLAEKIRLAVERAGIGKDEKGAGRALTVSIGVASLPGDAAGTEELVDRADRALYVAKSMGKNCVKPFSDEQREYTRLDVALSGHFSLLEKVSHSLTTLNLSEGGILFQCRETLPAGTFVKVGLALPPSAEPIECAVRVLRAVAARGGFAIGTEIVHMPRLHQRRFRMFLKQIRAGEIVRPASSRRRGPRPVEPKHPAEQERAGANADGRKASGGTLPLPIVA